MRYYKQVIVSSVVMTCVFAVVVVFLIFQLKSRYSDRLQVSQSELRLMTNEITRVHSQYTNLVAVISTVIIPSISNLYTRSSVSLSGKDSISSGGSEGSPYKSDFLAYSYSRLGKYDAISIDSGVIVFVGEVCRYGLLKYADHHIAIFLASDGMKTYRRSFPEVLPDKEPEPEPVRKLEKDTSLS